MRPDRRRLQRLSEDAGFRIGALEKVFRLAELLEDVAKHPYLPQRLLLKGGTVINLCFGPPRRLSVDLDFNYVGAESRAAMLREKPDVERALETVATGRRYSVQRSSDQHAGRKFYLRYENVTGAPDRLEIDVNYLFRVPVDGTESRPLWLPGEPDAASVRSVGTAELWIGKLVALLDRGAPRDLFDAAILCEREAKLVAAPQFRSLFVALAGTLPRPLHRYGRERLERISQAEIEEQLYPMLAGTERPARQELVEEAWSVLGPLLALRQPELEYCDQLNAGNLHPELLFADDETTADRLRRHPALRWKAQNAARRDRT